MGAAVALLDWFDRNRREMPWRAAPGELADPYRVWVSEIMLQQTRVETVIPYFERFLARFPTVEALARAEIDDLLALWSGLGYYRRARLMHAAAGEIARAGSFPATVEALRALPGVGEYTAAAVASIAFGVVEPVLDGNVERVMARFLAVAGDPKAKPVRRQLMAGAARLLDGDRPGDSNQALMELGATHCAPRRPTCLLCPLRDAGCRAAAKGNPEAYPPPRKRRAPVKVRRLLLWVESEAGVLLFRRPEDSALLAGTWELPWVDLAAAEGDQPDEPGIAARRLAERYGGTWQLGELLGAVKHGITHRAIEARIQAARFEAGERVAEGPAAAWHQRAAIAGLATSSLVDKAVSQIELRRAGRE